MQYLEWKNVFCDFSMLTHQVDMYNRYTHILRLLQCFAHDHRIFNGVGSSWKNGPLKVS